MKVIGITGGVGAGKSTILDYMEKHCKAKVLKADDIAHELMEPEGACYQALVERLPRKVFLRDGSIHRNALARLMFSQENLRETINSIVHPAVKVYIIDKIAKEREIDRLKYLVIEAALLIEEHYDEICDELWYVHASRENRRRRLTESRGYTEEKIESIFASQLTEEQYRSHCQLVIDNNGTKESAYLQIRQALQKKGEL